MRAASRVSDLETLGPRGIHTFFAHNEPRGDNEWLNAQLRAGRFFFSSLRPEASSSSGRVN